MLSNVKTPDLRDAATVTIGPLTFPRLDRTQAIALVGESVAQGRRLDVAICNAHTVLMALDDPSYAEVLTRMTLLNDGVGVNLASRIVSGVRFPDNLNGTDLVPEILARIDTPLRIFLLGATADSLEGAADHIARTHPRHEVVGYQDGFFADDALDDVVERINTARADLLLVAMGNPLQERFIADNRARLNATVCIGVGALFDFLSGRVVRAPAHMRAMGLEWLFRFLQEPRRLGRRYFVGIPRFLLAAARLPRSQDG